MEGTQFRYQLYNAAHKSGLVKLFSGARKLQWGRNVGVNGSMLDDKNASCSLDNFEDVDESTESSFAELSETSRTAPTGLSCTSCAVTFSNLLEQRQHFKLDWHRHNIKLRTHGQNPISETYFSEIMEGLSSISGSESEEEDVDDSKILNKKMERVGLTIKEGFPEDEISALYESNKKMGSSRLARNGKLFFQNDMDQIFTAYQAILPAVETMEEQLIENKFQEMLSSPLKLGVVMLSGGHFAAGIFEGNKEILHKTIHKYTVRAKQGGSQSRCDNKSGGSGPKSAGANLRRHNEQALILEIQGLINSWEKELSECEWIFHRIGRNSQQVFFDGKSPIFQKGHPKLRSIPFPTKRPTFSVIKKVVEQLCSFQVFDRDGFERRLLHPFPSSSSDSSQAFKKNRSQKDKSIDRGKCRSPKKREDPVPTDSLSEASDSEKDVESVLVESLTERDLRNELMEYDHSFGSKSKTKFDSKKKSRPKDLKNFKIEPYGMAGRIVDAMTKEVSEEDLLNLIQTRDITKEGSEERAGGFDADLNQILDGDHSTILHLAVKRNLLNVTWVLLELGSDPSLKDKSGKYPYNWSPTKECRILFRKFRGKFPDKYNYQKAQVPTPLTDEMEQEIAEKKKIQNKIKREKEKQKKMARKEQEDELDEQKRFLELTDREKRALAAERRRLLGCLRNGESKPVLLRCFDCAIDITGKVPFEYNQNKFCSTRCLAAHRKKFPIPLSV